MHVKYFESLKLLYTILNSILCALPLVNWNYIVNYIVDTSIVNIVHILKSTISLLGLFFYKYITFNISPHNSEFELEQI